MVTPSEEEDHFLNSNNNNTMIHPEQDDNEKKLSSPSQETKRAVDVDEYLEYVGRFGRCQILLLLLFCLIIIPSTYQTLVMSFAGHNPSWRCVIQPNVTNANSTSSSNDTDHCSVAGDISSKDDYYKARCQMNRSLWEYAKDKDYSIVTEWDLVCEKKTLSYLANSAMFLGWAIGAVVLGWCADKYGRKKVLYPAWFALILAAFISGFSHALWLFIVLRVIIGFCQGGVGLCLFVMATELVGPSWRSFAGTSIWFAFTIALCIIPVQAMYLKWKMLEILLSIPYIWLAGFYFVTPESVRWLRVKDRIDEAEAILKKVARVNKMQVPDDIRLSSPPKSPMGKKTTFIDLFRPSHIAISTAIQCFAWFVCGQVYYGISLASDQLGGDMYRDFVLTSLVEIPGNIILIYLTNKFGRKPTVIYSMLGSGLSCIAVAFIPNSGAAKWGRVSLGMLGKLGITISFNSIYIWSVELFPTIIRTQGMGLMIVVSRLGAASAPWVAQYLNEVHDVLPFTVMGGLGVIASIVCFKLKETNGIPTAETMDGAENNENVELKDFESSNGKSNAVCT
ncbi:organic cation transporter protein-like [Clytia hemisphaerica]|uniref:Major facilitator superfamily (MFS) profile domain-containing protein n=1 Tax=Clytia hemisphaerica TaxID=252671 RepID=A0A7M5WRE2_9CNID|eukprot:TCONS_00072938-protein